MILEEDYRNLKRIDPTILNAIDFEDLKSISIDSEIVIDKVRDPHTFTHIIEILNEEENGGIVFRASRRQLFIVLKEYTGDSYKIIFSDYVLQNIPAIEKRYNRTERIDGDSYLRTIISTVFQNVYGDDETIKKVWDILVIKASNKEEIKRERMGSRYGMIPTEKEDKEGYNNYLKALKLKLNDKLEEYKESKMPNLRSGIDFMEYLITNERLNKIKLKDTVYTLYERINAENNGKNFVYKKSNNGNFPYEYITLRIDYNGLFPEFGGVYGHDRLYSNEVNDIRSQIK